MLPVIKRCKRFIYHLVFRWNGEDLEPGSFEKYEKITEAPHKKIRLANFLDQPLAVGGIGNNKVELLENGLWTQLPDYRYHPEYESVTITSIDR